MRSTWPRAPFLATFLCVLSLGVVLCASAVAKQAPSSVDLARSNTEIQSRVSAALSSVQRAKDHVRDVKQQRGFYATCARCTPDPREAEWRRRLDKAYDVLEQARTQLDYWTEVLTQKQLRDAGIESGNPCAILNAELFGGDGKHGLAQRYRAASAEVRDTQRILEVERRREDEYRAAQTQYLTETGKTNPDIDVSLSGARDNVRRFESDLRAQQQSLAALAADVVALRRELRDKNCTETPSRPAASSSPPSNLTAWTGEWVDPGGTVTTIIASGDSLRADYTWRDSDDGKPAPHREVGHYDCTVTGNKAKCDFKAEYTDPEKDWHRTGTITMTLNGNTIKGTTIYGKTTGTWRVTPYLTPRQGAVPFTMTRNP